MNPLISIIIPAYNIGQYIIRSLESISNQTYSNLEIIVVDDGSKDNTGRLIDEYALKDNRVKTIHQSNKGVSAARNAALNIAQGDYIGFLDGDDTAESDMYEFLLKHITESQADIAHCGYKMVYPSKIVYYHKTGCYKVQSNEEGLIDLLKGDIVEPGIWNKLYRKELFDKIRFDETIRINEDLKINYELFKQSMKSVFIDVPKYNYILRRNSAATSKLNINKVRDPYVVTKEILMEISKDSNIYPYIYRMYINRLINICGIKKSSLLQINEVSGFQRSVHDELKTRRKEILKSSMLDSRTKVKFICCTYFNRLYLIAKRFHNKVLGRDKKYEVK